MIVKRTTLTRTIGELRRFLQQGQVAFYLGAGVDIQLALDANAEQSPNWSELLLNLNFSNEDGNDLINLYPEDLTDERKESLDELWKYYANSWPAEIASLARWRRGDKVFSNLISRKIEDKSFSPDINKKETSALCNLLSYSNIIFTPNYASYITKALKKAHPNVEYVVLDREDLDGFVFPDPAYRKDIKICYIIHIHGRVSSRSFPILDAWGYNIAQSDDPSYLKLLESLFKTRHVITIGTSWSDVPIRNINGYLNRKYPYLGRSHLALMYKRTLPITAELINSQVLWSNAMNAAYGVNFHFVDSSTQLAALKSLVIPLNDPDNVENLKEVSEFLDSTGDYESQLQHLWLMELGKDKDDSKELNEYDATIIGVEVIKDKIFSILESDKKSDWETAARIERHLRHQLYLYGPKNKAEIRFQIWEALFNKFKANYSQMKKMDERLLFDFLTGAFEIAQQSSEYISEFIPLFLKGEFRERLKIAEHVWKAIPPKDNVSEWVKDLEQLERLAIKLLDTGWEAMSAKIITDKAFLMAEGIKKHERSWLEKGETPRFGYYDIINEAKRAEGIARVTGCFRRRTKVDVLDALWNKDRVDARHRLLAQLQSGNYLSSNMRIEPAMKNAIGIGLVVNQFRFEESSTPEKNAYETAKGTLEEAGILPKDALTIGNVNFWSRIVPSELETKYKSLQSEVAGAK